MKQQMIITVLLIAAVSLGAGFFAGTKYQQSKRGNFVQFTGTGGGNMMLRNGGTGNGSRNGFRPVMGEVIKSDDTSVTVKLSDGSSKIVLINDKTTVNKAELGSRADLVTGVTVAVFGSTNADGSVTAQNVQLNPGMNPSGTPNPTP